MGCLYYYINDARSHKHQTFFHLVQKFRMSGAIPPLRGLRMDNFTTWMEITLSVTLLNTIWTSRHRVTQSILPKPTSNFFGIVIPLCLLMDICFCYRSEHITLNTTQSSLFYSMFWPSSDRITIT